ncbi:MAG: hypothetical protein ABIK28_11810 [Planctomycetota bacterium]
MRPVEFIIKEGDKHLTSHSGLALMAYNLLRLCGQESLREDNGNLGERASHRKKAQRRRLRTVMQDLIYMASRIRCPFLTILRGKHIECHGFR